MVVFRKTSCRKATKAEDKLIKKYRKKLWWQGVATLYDAGGYYLSVRVSKEYDGSLPEKINGVRIIHETRSKATVL